MAELEYNVNVNVEGKEDVDELATDLETIQNTDATVTVTGAAETAESLETIADSDAATTIGDVGVAAETSSTPVGKLGAGFRDMVAAIGVATIAGAGIDVLMGQIRTRLDFIAETKAWDAAQVEEYKAAVADVGAGLEAIETKLRAAGEFLNIETSGLFGLGGGETSDAAVALGEFGFTVDDVARAIRGGDEALDGFESQLQAAGLGGDLLDDVMGAVRDEADSYAEATNGAAQRTAFFAETAASATDKLQAMLDQQEPTRRFTEEWTTLGNAIADGTISSGKGADALNTLTEGLGLTTEQVLALAQAQVDEGVAGAQAYADALDSVDFRDSDLRGATTAFSNFTRGLFAAGNETQRVESAYAAMAAAVGDGTLNLNTATESGRAQQDALEGVAAVLDGQLAEAYDTANGSQDAFIASATKLGDETLARLQADLGLTDGQVNVLRETLGLTAADYEARFNLAGDEEAIIQLGILQGAITGLPDDVESTVNLLVLAGDYVGAVAAIQTYYDTHPATLPITYGFADVGTAFASFAGEGLVLKAPTVAPITEEDEIEVSVVLSDAVARAAFETFFWEMTDFGNIDAKVKLDSREAELNMLAFVNEERTTTIVAEADTVGADTELDLVAAEQRTATIDVVTGSISLPSNTQLRNAIGTIRIPIQAYWNTRIEGNRPV